MLDFTFYIFLSKFLHSLYLWVSFSINEKIALDKYVEVMYIEGADQVDRPTPPPLWHIPLRVFIPDLAIIALITATIYLVVTRLIEEPIIGGSKVFMLIATDLILSMVLAFIASVGISLVAQNQTCCRYADDGVRGIRAYCLIALAISLALCLPPFFLLIA